MQEDPGAPDNVYNKKIARRCIFLISKGPYFALLRPKATGGLTGQKNCKKRKFSMGIEPGSVDPKSNVFANEPRRKM